MRTVVIDIGQSGSRVRTNDGPDLAVPVHFRRQRPLPELVLEVLRTAGVRDATTVGLSLTGLRGVVSNGAELGRACHAATGASAVAIADDGLAGLFGALAGADGVAMAVGSGVAVVSKHADHIAHLDGDGPLLGDDGGGFSIGSSGLRAALRAAEGRGPATSILAIAESRYGDLRAASRQHSDAEVHGWCIDMARPVLEAATAGDAVAVAIRTEAAQRLADTAVAAWRAVDGGTRVAISGTGGILRDTDLRLALLLNVQQVLPEASWVSPAGDNLDGMQRIVDTHRRDLPPLLEWWHHNA